MNRTPSYYLVFFLPDGTPSQKKVEKTMFNSLAQNEVIKEVDLNNAPYIITHRRSFNIFNSTTSDYFLIMDVVKNLNA